jgi:creatinine amidohydrolase
MNWEALTGPEFKQAVKRARGVCLVAIGCVEQHGPHLPLGTDYLNGHRICTLAAEKEPALVFPPYYFGQIHEARHCPGTVATDPQLTLQLLLNVCDEISRNGCDKIVFYNAHGGNTHMLGYFVQCLLAKPRPYTVYCPERLDAEGKRKRAAILATERHAHACECETSISLANHPHLVRMQALKNRTGEPLRRLAALPAGFTPVSWYADFPEHYAGDARPATREKGEQLRQLIVDHLAACVRAIKADRVVLRLQQEFYARAACPCRSRRSAAPRK